MKKTLTITLTLAAAIAWAAAGFSMTPRESQVAGLARVEPVPEGIKVGSQISGKVKHVRVEEGAQVRRGQIVAILEFDDAMARCASAEAALEDALHRDGVIARYHEVAKARARVEQARAEWEKHFIRAPISGVILRKHVRDGETVSEMRDTPVVTVADPSALRVRTDAGASLLPK